MPFTPDASLVSYLSFEGKDTERSLSHWTLPEGKNFGIKLIRKPSPPIFKIGSTEFHENIIVTDVSQSNVYEIAVDPSSKDLVFTKSVSSQPAVELARVSSWDTYSKKERAKCRLTFTLPDSKPLVTRPKDFFEKSFLSRARVFKSPFGTTLKWTSTMYAADSLMECPHYWLLQEKNTNQVIATTERMDLHGKDGRMEDETNRHPLYVSEDSKSMLDFIVITVLLCDLLN